MKRKINLPFIEKTARQKSQMAEYAWNSRDTKMKKSMSFNQKFVNLVNNRCPICSDGNLWVSKNPYYNILHFSKACNKECSHCGFRFEMEPGFWYGSMYVNYVLAAVVFIAVYAFTSFATSEMGLWTQISIIEGVVIFFIPISLYFSRLIWLYMFAGNE